MDWPVKAAIFSLAAAVGGAGTGFGLGSLGQAIGSESRVTASALLALVFLVIGALDLVGVRVPLVQWNRETRQAWVHFGAIGWSLVNGLALGAGFLSRIGFLAWYTIPFACLAFGSPVLGALIFGAYGATRGLLVWPTFLVMRRGVGQTEIAETLFTLVPSAERVSAYLVIWLAAMATVVVGT